MDVSEITCSSCWVKGQYTKGCKDLKRPKIAKKEEKKGSKKDSKIKTDSTAEAAAVAASIPICKSRPVTIVNVEGAWSAHVDENVCTAQTIVKDR